MSASGHLDAPASVHELNPHLRPAGPSPDSCPYGECDGSGFVLGAGAGDGEGEGEDAGAAPTARPCRCRPERIAAARARGLSRAIPRRYRDLAFDRAPVKDMDPAVVRHVQRFCRTVAERLERGEGMWFMGPRGTGKTTLAMLISQHAMRARRTVAVYTLPQLLAEIRKTYDADATETYLGLMDRLSEVDLLHLEDMAVAQQTDWVLEQLYTVVNRRYEDERSIVFTADVAAPPELGEHVGERTWSRLIEMCGDPVPMLGEDRRIVRGA